jgi:nicotinamidase-related amidase
MSVLAIVDMQTDFAPANDQKTIDEVKKQIELAKRYKRWIFLIEYSRHGPTLYELRKAIGNYSNVIKVRKRNNDGGIDIIDKAFTEGINLRKIYVSGVNVGFCVKSTVESLSKFLPSSDIFLVKNACNCSKSKKDFSFVRKLPNVTLV